MSLGVQHVLQVSDGHFRSSEVHRSQKVQSVNFGDFLRSAPLNTTAVVVLPSSVQHTCMVHSLQEFAEYQTRPSTSNPLGYIVHSQNDIVHKS